MKISVYFIIASLVFCFIGVYMHELNHQRIYESHGIPSTIHVGFPDWYVTPDVSTPGCDSNCNLEQTINDSVGYNMIPIIMIIVLGIFCLITVLEEKNERR